MMSVRGVPRTRSLLLSALLVLLASPGPRSQSWAQVVCGTTSATPLQIQDVADARTLGAAVNCTDGGTVEAVWAGVVTLDAPISIGSGTFLSITGEDALAEVRGGSQSRMFDVSPAGGLTLTQLKLTGGSATSGGAIHSSMATVTLDSCVFDGNVATAGDGGALWVEGGDLTIVAGEFSGNSASENGGAVFVLDAGLVIQGGTLFERNTARLEGGGLYCGGAEATVASCSLTEAVFTSNQATLETEFSFTEIESWLDLYGGGAAAFWNADVNITGSLFEFNFAQVSGGAIFGGTDSAMTIDDCTFQNNTSEGYGGAVVASSATLGGSTLVVNNEAGESGGGVFGWDSAGSIEFNDVVCSQNAADENGGCFFSVGRGVVNNGTAMLDNLADAGGCIYAAGGSDINVDGGEFTGCRCHGNGGFLYASDGSLVNITGGTVTKNVAERRAGAVYCSGDSNTEGGSKVTIEGGTFSDNQALELGGAIAAWGTTSEGPTPTVVTITGGVFSNNTAKFYGGFIFLEELASLSCEGATIRDHYAGDQGGAIYGRDATWVNSSCDLIGNKAPQGAAAYLTHTVGGAYFENHEVTDNVASGGSVVYATESSVIAKGVSFQSGPDLQEDSSNRAIQLEGVATLVAEGCVFSGWTGNTVVYNANPADGSLVLDSCDFSESTTVMVVTSPYSDARIRNAVIDQHTIENAAVYNNSLLLVDRALGCGESSTCGPGECVDSALGVLCECLEDGVCLDGGGALSISLKTPPPTVTYSPDLVYFELMVSAAGDGTTPAIWSLTYEADELALQVLPSSGVLPPGSNVTVTVTGSPLQQDVGGNLMSRFVATPVGSGNANSNTGVEIEEESAFYLCQAFEYAMPVDDGGVTCEQCVTISGAEGVDCELPGATLASLPVREGYWRSSRESLVIQPCLHPDACAGATQVSSSDDYCQEGYEGPYCAVCAEGYGKGTSHACHSCTGVKSRLLIFAGCFFGLMILTLLFVAVVFLIGGLDAVDGVRLSLSRTLAVSAKAHSSAARSSPTRGSGMGVKSWSRSSTIRGSAGDVVAPASSATTEVAGGEGKTHVAFDSAVSMGSSERVVSAAGGIAHLRDVGKEESVSSGSGNSGCCGVGEKIKRWASRVPLDKLKILVVVWQILTVFPSITGVEFPPSYSRFLSWIDFVNLDVGRIFSSSCVLPAVDFHQRLLLTTLSPLGLAAVLVLTYRMAKRRAGIGSAGVVARRAAWSRHMAAGLLLTFLVFTSTSTMAFKTFPCDKEAIEGESFLRADYSLSCNSDKHTYFKVYAGFMIVLYPIGIPLLYALILWMNRDSLNPRVQATTSADPESGGEEAAKNRSIPPNEQYSLQEKLEKRSQNPDLVPSMFLWKDFGPDMYYYEVIECGRRILLTGVLIFFTSGTAPQAAMACIFAFASLLGFELLRPHLDAADAWLYRLGCVVIFLSNFLALLIKVDAAGEGNRGALGGIMIAINVFLILAVLSTSWFATQQSVDDNRNEENSLALAKTMLTFEQHAADSVRLSRQEKTRITSSSSSATATASGGGGAAGLPVRASKSVHPRPPHGHPSGGGGGDNEEATAGRGGARERRHGEKS